MEKIEESKKKFWRKLRKRETGKEEMVRLANCQLLLEISDIQKRGVKSC